MMRPECLSQEQMLAYALGMLPLDSLEAVAAHVDVCSDCQTTVDSLQHREDTMISELRPIAAEPEFQEEPEFLEAVSRAAHLLDQPLDNEPSQPGRGEDPQAATSTSNAKHAIDLSLDQLRAALVDAGLVSAGELKSLSDSLPATQIPADAQSLASVLVERGKLTAFQAQVACEGNVRSLVFDEYIVLDKIGAGGMGQVFQARHRRMERVVALKVLPSAAITSPESVQRFHREIKAAARLTHPNIVVAYDAGEAHGQHYLVMEYVAGQNLAGILKQQGRLSVEQAVGYVVQAARGLAFVHSKGIVHRDVKPANLLLDHDGVVKVLDLGLAQIDSPLGDATGGLTDTGNIMGTIDYMAPEQALDTKRADHRADIYGLGCTLYFLLTGKRMYDGSTIMKRLLAHREGAIPSLRAVRPEAPPSLDAVYQKMVAKLPADRFPSMSEAQAALEAALRGGDARAVRQPSRGLIGGATGVAVLIALGLGGFLLRGVIFKYETPAGTITVEVDQPGAVVTLDGKQTLILHPAGDGEAVEVRAVTGKHTLEVRKGGFRIFTKEFVLDEGEPNRIGVRLEPLAVALSPAATSEPNLNSDPNRRAATWALRLGGEVTVVTSGPPGNNVKFLQDLPSKPFRLREIHFPIGARVNDLENLRGAVHLETLAANGVLIGDEGLAALPELRALYRLYLGQTQITDAALRQIATLPELGKLELQETRITDAGLAHLQHLKHLHEIYLTETLVGDEGLKTLAGLTGLRKINVALTRVSDAGLASLKGLVDLTFLDLGMTGISDRGLVELHGFSQLRTLSFVSTQITDVGMRSLRELKSLTSLNLDHTRVTDAGLVDIGQLTNLTFLNLDSLPITDQGLIPLKSLTRLRTLIIAKTAVTDAGLEHLARLTNLISLNMKSTAITAAGADRLRAALPACKIEWTAAGK